MNDVKAKNIDLHSSFMKMNTKNVAATKEGEKIDRLPQSKLGLVVNVDCRVTVQPNGICPTFNYDILA